MLDEVFSNKVLCCKLMLKMLQLYSYKNKCIHVMETPNCNIVLIHISKECLKDSSQNIKFD